MSNTQSAAPTPKRVDAERVHHDDVFLDPYEWMRDKSDPEVIAHLEAENTHVDEVTAYQEPLRQRIFDEIKARTKETDLSVPLRRGDWWYYGRSLEGKQYGVHCRRPISGPDDWDPPVFDEQTAIPGEQILLDENLEAEGHDYFAVGAASVSPDGHILAYSTDVVGDERYTLQFKDLRTGELSADRITGIASGITWATDSATVYYTTVDEAWRPDTVWRHRLGHAGHDEQVFTEPDERFWVAVGRTRSNAYIVIAAGSSITSEVRVADASDPQAEFVPVLPRRDGVEYSVDHVIVGGEDRFLILHNDGAPNFTLVDAPVDDPSAQRTLIPARDDVRLEGVDVFAGHIVVHDRREALPRLQLWPVTETGYGTPADITFDSELMACGLGGNPNWDAPRLRVGATSFMTPMRIYDIDLRAAEVGGGERTLLREQPVLGGYRREDYVERRDWALAEDGTRIPISLMYRKDIQFPAPTVLYGYGAYESSEDPRFSIARLSLLDRGMVFAVAHVRGGGEMGRLWYERGKLLEKKNTFTDFIAAGRHLVDSGLTGPRNLVALGGSAGGLLMGAVANMAPELFAGILAQVPFVDPLTTILDPSLPLTVTEWDEWGNPLEDSDVYFYMKSYSPYENVEAKEYPAILAMTSLNDTRVFYVEPAKWVAALRHAKTDPHPVLLRTQMAAGHGGISGRYERWREAAFQYAWLLATADPDRFGKGAAES